MIVSSVPYARPTPTPISNSAIISQAVVAILTVLLLDTDRRSSPDACEIAITLPATIRFIIKQIACPVGKSQGHRHTRAVNGLLTVGRNTPCHVQQRR